MKDLFPVTYISVKKAAALFKTTEVHIRGLLAVGAILGYKEKGSWAVNESSAADYFSKHPKIIQQDLFVNTV